MSVGPEDEAQKLRQQNLQLLEKISTLQDRLAAHESQMVQVLLTVDPVAALSIRPDRDYDGSIADGLNDLFSHAKDRLRVAIPYVTKGGFKDFSTILARTFPGPARVDLLFRHPSPGEDHNIHELIHDAHRSEIAAGKVRIRYLGSRGRSGLHAKTVIQDEDACLVSSANWTGYSLNTNAEVGILTRSRRATRLLIRWFDYCFETAHTLTAVQRGGSADEPV